MRAAFFWIFLPAFLLTATSSFAEEKALTISGATDKTVAAPLMLSIEEFEAIGISELSTRTPWHKDKTTFSGVSGRALMAYLGGNATVIEAVALNDYKVEIPLEDLRSHNPLFATRKNGELMSVRDKGPVFLIYPFDAKPELNNEIIFGRSIWQVKALSFK